jgi:hypothetical protein
VDLKFTANFSAPISQGHGKLKRLAPVLQNSGIFVEVGKNMKNNFPYWPILPCWKHNK